VRCETSAYYYQSDCWRESESRATRLRTGLRTQDDDAYFQCRAENAAGLRVMKVVLFCGGLGTRIREYSEDIPKPMIPIGHQPILWHVMQYYSQYGHRDFILCLGYKANVVKDYFLNYRQAANTDCTISQFGKKIELLGERPADWRVSLVDTGIWRNIGQRLLAVRHLVQDQEIFLANYSDGLTDAPLPDMITRFKKSGKIACFVAIHPPITFHLTDFDDKGVVRRINASHESEIWINGGYFIFRNEIFDYIQEGEELVVEPFKRLIERGDLMAYRYEGFWRAMDTLRDRQVLEEMIERGDTPWQLNTSVPAAVSA
jgi:glucose-1-phosphate cytidylyltransferase